MIYLDNSATTIPDPAVVESFQKVTEQFFANPSSLHQLGGTAEQLLLTAKKQAAEILKVEDEEIVFTSGGTEGNNIAIKGIALEHQNRGKHIIISAVEHPSVDETCQSLKKLGFEITVLPVNEEGIINVKELEATIREDTILVSIMHVNNELGSIQPIETIGEMTKKYPKLFFHVDAVQGLGKIPLQLKNTGIDLCTFSGHKIHGLKGTGILYIKKGTSLFPLFDGGGQEFGLRAGTENLAGAVSIVKALRLIKENEEKQYNKLVQLSNKLKSQLKNIKEIRMNTPEGAAPHIINISVPGIKPEVIIHMLGEKDIFISTKSACSSKQKDESKILTACGLDRELAISGLRISLSYHNTTEEIDKFVEELEKAVNQFKEVLR